MSVTPIADISGDNLAVTSRHWKAETGRVGGSNRRDLHSATEELQKKKQIDIYKQ